MRRHWGPVRFYAMHRHWAQYGPPVYVAVAAYLGLNKRNPADIGAAQGDGSPESDGETLEALLGMFGEGYHG